MLHVHVRDPKTGQGSSNFDEYNYFIGRLRQAVPKMILQVGPGVRRHVKGALKAGATVEEIMEVLKLCVVQGVQACNLGVPILAEELARISK